MFSCFCNLTKGQKQMFSCFCSLTKGQKQMFSCLCSLTKGQKTNVFMFLQPYKRPKTNIFMFLQPYKRSKQMFSRFCSLTKGQKNISIVSASTKKHPQHLRRDVADARKVEDEARPACATSLRVASLKRQLIEAGINAHGRLRLHCAGVMRHDETYLCHFFIRNTT